MPRLFSSTLLLLVLVLNIQSTVALPFLHAVLPYLQRLVGRNNVTISIPTDQQMQMMSNNDTRAGWERHCPWCSADTLTIPEPAENYNTHCQLVVTRPIDSSYPLDEFIEVAVLSHDFKQLRGIVMPVPWDKETDITIGLAAPYRPTVGKITVRSGRSIRVQKRDTILGDADASMLVFFYGSSQVPVERRAFRPENGDDYHPVLTADLGCHSWNRCPTSTSVQPAPAPSQPKVLEASTTTSTSTTNTSKQTTSTTSTAKSTSSSSRATTPTTSTRATTSTTSTTSGMFTNSILFFMSTNAPTAIAGSTIETTITFCIDDESDGEITQEVTTTVVRWVTDERTIDHTVVSTMLVTVTTTIKPIPMHSTPRTTSTSSTMPTEITVVVTATSTVHVPSVIVDVTTTRTVTPNARRDVDSSGAREPASVMPDGLGERAALENMKSTTRRCTRRSKQTGATVTVTSTITKVTGSGSHHHHHHKGKDTVTVTSVSTTTVTPDHDYHHHRHHRQHHHHHHHEVHTTSSPIGPTTVTVPTTVFVTNVTTVTPTSTSTPPALINTQPPDDGSGPSTAITSDGGDTGRLQDGLEPPMFNYSVTRPDGGRHISLVKYPDDPAWRGPIGNVTEDQRFVVYYALFQCMG